MNKVEQILREGGVLNSKWGKVILEAEGVGCFTSFDKDMSSDWFSCACGELDDHIERRIYGEPMDAQLRNYGEAFEDYVKIDNYIDAAKTLVLIEKRSMELLHEISR